MVNCRLLLGRFLLISMMLSGVSNAQTHPRLPNNPRNSENVRILAIIADYQDVRHTGSRSEIISAWQRPLEIAEEYWQRNSYGKITSFDVEFAPSIRLPYNLPQQADRAALLARTGTQAPLDAVMSDVSAELATRGINVNDYDILLRLFRGGGIVSGIFGSPGRADHPGGVYYTGDAAKIGNIDHTPSGLVHELGHSLGIRHPGIYNSVPGNVFPGYSTREEGLSPSMMGSGRVNNPYSGRLSYSAIDPVCRYGLGYLTDTNVKTARLNETVRIYDFNTDRLTPGNDVAVVLNVPSGRAVGDWWLCFNPSLSDTLEPANSPGTNVWRDGIGVFKRNFVGPYYVISDILDFTPNSVPGETKNNKRDDARDGALTIGSQWTFPESNIQLKPISKGTRNGVRYIDVQIIDTSNPGGSTDVNFVSPSPSNNANLSVGSNISIRVAAPTGTRNVRLFRNGTLVRQEGGAPYDWNGPGQNDGLLRNLAAGSYTFRADVTPRTGAVISKTLRITVGGGTGGGSTDVNFVSPSPSNNANLSVGSNISIRVAAPSGTRNVRLFRNGTLVRQEGGAPYDWNGPGQNDGLLRNLAAGTYTFRADVTPRTGAVISKTLRITVGGGGSTGGTAGDPNNPTNTGPFVNRNQYLWDLGSASSPLASGSARITHQTTSGFVRWLNNNDLVARDRNSGGGRNATTRDFVQGRAARTLTHQLTNGSYAVEVTLGDGNFTKRDVIVRANGVTVASNVDTAVNEFKVASFNVTITNGKLDLEFESTAGNRVWAVNQVKVTKATSTAFAQTFDFGTNSSPLAAGATRVTASTVSGAYRWLNASNLTERNRNTTGDLNRDLIFSSATRTFEVNVPNGTYAVSVTTGDFCCVHDQMVIRAEGSIEAQNITNRRNEFIVSEFTTNVSDGKLTLEFSDGGGSDVNWAVNGLTITRQ